MKKPVALALVIIILLGIAPVSVAADSTAKQYSIKYNDVLDISKDFPGFSVCEITNITVKSKKVLTGIVTKQPDSVLIKQIGKNKFVATGTGEAYITLKKDSEIPRKAGTEITTKIKVSISPAPLTVMYLAGQSNMEGCCSKYTGYRPQNSVICDEFSVFSSFAPTTASRFYAITGETTNTVCNTDNADDFISGSLKYGETKSINGKKLVYPLNALSRNGKGKTGPDSGIAYKWNLLTKDKVYIVNAAFGGTKIEKWIPGTRFFDRALSFFKSANRTVNSEISAGHYTLKHSFLFWLQGESDRKTPLNSYGKDFLKMAEGFKKSLPIEKIAIISVRGSSTGKYTDKTDLYMTASRIIQYSVSADSSYKYIYTLSNVNEKWVTDKGVKDYFLNQYPDNKLTYPIRSNSLHLPKTVNEVHSDIHYSQKAHNENGITVAANLYKLINKKSTVPKKVAFFTDKEKVSSEIFVPLNDTRTLVYEVYPLTSSKSVKITFSSDGIKYDKKSGKLSSLKKGEFKLYALSSDGKKLKTITVTSDKLKTPVLVSAENNQNGITVKWKSVKYSPYYTVYRKTESGWKKIGSTSSCSFTDTKVTSGKTYTYTVRCTGNDKKTKTSGYDKSGIKCCYLSRPSLKVSSNNNKLCFKWSAVTGCSGYKITYEVDKKSYSVKINNPNTLKYTLKTPQKGKKYSVTVRAYKTTSQKTYYSLKSVQQFS